MKNYNKVPKKQWCDWSNKAKEVFNKTYDFFYYNQKLITHPKMGTVCGDYWKTISWNAAWIAADAVDNAGIYSNDPVGAEDAVPTEIIEV